MIELKNVTKTYAEGNPALTDIDLRIEKGEFVFIVGGSGAGKTTLLKLLIAEDKPTSGSIRVVEQQLEAIKRRQIPGYRRKIGIVFRDFRLFADKTVYENVAFALRVIGEPSASIRTKVMASLQMVELSDKVKCYPGELSGCEQQRVALARAIAGGPSVIIADEPCGNIDPVESRDLIELFGRIQSRYEKTVVVLTHDRELAESFGHRIVSLKRGRIEDDRAAYMPGELYDVSLSEEDSSAEEESILTAEETLPAAEELPVSAAVPTIEYDLSALVAAGERDAHTADDWRKAATQMFDAPGLDEPPQEADASDGAEPTEEAAEAAADAPDEVSQAAAEALAETPTLLSVPTPSEEAPAADAVPEEATVCQMAEPKDDTPTVVIPVIDPDAVLSAKKGSD